MSQSNWGTKICLCVQYRKMTNIFNLLSLDFIALIRIASMVSGVIKGVVGFGMPMIFITFMTMYVDPALALGILILPTLTTNA